MWGTGLQLTLGMETLVAAPSTLQKPEASVGAANSSSAPRPGPAQQPVSSGGMPHTKQLNSHGSGIVQEQTFCGAGAGRGWAWEELGCLKERGLWGISVVSQTPGERGGSTESGGWWASLELIPEKCVQIPYLPSLLQPGGGREPEDQASVRSFIHLTSIFCAPRMCDERERSAALI